jgi:CRP-like cAMP-binding protein
MSALQQSTLRNQLLAGMTREDFEALKPHLMPAHFELRKVLHAPNQPIEHVYFLEGGMVSVLAILEGGDLVEVGVIGWEGLVGLAVVLGAASSVVETMVQIPGTAWRVRADTLRDALDRSATLRAVLSYS